MTTRYGSRPEGGEAADAKPELEDNGGMRKGSERRQAADPFEGSERRTGRDRRRGFDRRSGIDRRWAADRRSRRLFRDGESVERRDALRRLSDEE